MAHGHSRNYTTLTDATRLSREIGGTLTVSDAIALLIYDYLVKHSATRVLPKIGLDDSGSTVTPTR